MGQAHEINNVQSDKRRTENEPFPGDFPNRAQRPSMEEPSKASGEIWYQRVRHNAEDLCTAARSQVVETRLGEVRGQ